MKIRTFVVLIAAIGVGAWLLSSAEGRYSTQINATDNMAENISYATFADDAAFTPASSGVLMFGAEADDTSPDSVTEGDAGAVRMSLRRELYVQIRDAAGNERGLNVDANNRIGVVEVSASGAATSLTTIAGAIKAEDAVHGDGNTGIMALAVRDDSPIGAKAGTTGDYSPLSVDDDGDLYVVDSAGNALLTTIDADTSKIPSQGTAAMAGSTPVTIATDDTVLLRMHNVAKGAAVADSGQHLDNAGAGTAANTAYSVLVEALATYRVHAVNGVIYLGIEDTTASDADVLWIVGAGDTEVLTIPNGTALYYHVSTAGVEGRLARIQ